MKPWKLYKLFESACAVADVVGRDAHAVEHTQEQVAHWLGTKLRPLCYTNGTSELRHSSPSQREERLNFSHAVSITAKNNTLYSLSGDFVSRTDMI